jgi:hypothetical protein
MVEGMNMIYLIYYKNFYKCHNVPPPSTTTKKEKEKKESEEVPVGGGGKYDTCILYSYMKTEL